MEQSKANKCVVAVTRNGMGDFWLFDSFEQADQHPIVQYGDVICRGPDHILRQYTMLEIPDLLTRLGDVMFRREVLLKLADPMGAQEALSRYLPSVWERMVGAARRTPESAEEIVSIIVNDRKLSLREARVKEKIMTASEAKENKATKAPKEPKEAAPKTIAGYKLDQKITMLVDKDGKPYDGETNNPKRPGSATHERFKAYKNGATIEEVVSKGVRADDLSYDVGKGFIAVA